ncbi:response regulator [Ideonella sp. DXS22W]|uniref:Response regulator n=1 Tax=Pseudaquabacterium inlustre TaxID=2984192 RepID=A0ABU9CNR5_9BURK
MPCCLIVDDNALNRELAAHLLAGDGFEVIEADGAVAALAQLSLRVPDVMLLDLAMPGMDGFALAALLRRAPATATLPLVAFTALALPREREAALAAGCNGCITKPIEIDQFVGQVRAWLR